MFDFKINDRVTVGKTVYCGLEGLSGRIVFTGNGTFGIEFDEFMNGHTCNGKCKDGHGWVFGTRNTSIVFEESESKVDFTSDEILDCILK